MNDEATLAWNAKFTDQWEKGANAIDSKLIIAIGQTENTRLQIYGNDMMPVERVIKILRHVADMLETARAVKLE